MPPDSGEARLLAAILENTRAHLAYLDPDFLVVRVNSAYAQACRMKPEEMVGRNHFDLLPNEEFEAIFRRVRDTRVPFESTATPFEFADQPERGTTYWDWTLTPVMDEQGQVEGLVFSVLEVTEQVRARQKLEEAEHQRAEDARLLATILSTVDSSVAYLDTDFRVRDINAAVVQTLDLPESRILGADVFDLIPGVAKARPLFRKVRDTGEPQSCREQPLRLRGESDPESYWNWTLRAVKNEEGGVKGLVLTAHEVTEEVQQREKLVQVERSRRQFAETMAAEMNHRMKNNLTMAAGLLHLQAMQQGLDETARHLIDTAAARISSIAAVHEEMYERRQEAANVVDLLRRTARANVEAVGASDVEMSVDGDELYCGPKAATSLSIVASELVLNGLKHGGPDEDGRHRIKILARRSADRLRLSVWNSGEPVAQGAGCSPQPRMGMKLIDEVICGQFGGDYSLRPEGLGTLAEVVVSQEKLWETETQG